MYIEHNTQMGGTISFERYIAECLYDTDRETVYGNNTSMGV